MRHRNRRSRLSMMTAHRNAMLRNMVTNLFKYQRIETTLARAKETRRLAEHVITLCKEGTVVSRRHVYAVIPDRDIIKKLYTEIAPLFKTRVGGYTRIIPTGFRRGDGAALAFLELTERKFVEKKPIKKKEKAQAASTNEKIQSKAAKPESTVAVEEEKKEAHKETPRIKSMPKGKPTLDEEKRAEKAKSEDKKVADQRGFMKNIRGIFRKRGDR